MKKTTLVGILAVSVSSFAVAEGNFTGFSVGTELSSTKHTFEIPGFGVSANSSNKASIGVFGQYGFDFAGDFVGIGEIKLRTGGSKASSKTCYETTRYGAACFGTPISKETFNIGIAYLQGYRVADSILPYIKIGGEISSFDLGKKVSQYTEGSSLFGVAYGAGIKYALTENVEAGVEYTQTRLRNVESDIKAKVNKIALNVAYRF
ncbi:porin family protein [Rodentibacter caecimuris]|uniref:porin family protein n=1 Tax=Rodentibacter caecimuris TaxID=1796644 RepID=UPI00211A2E5C|nr:porin family protein [Rodentibacter heylii]MCQ9123670.1 porin family protein [Rodentibacter heylii]